MSVVVNKLGRLRFQEVNAASWCRPTSVLPKYGFQVLVHILHLDAFECLEGFIVFRPHIRKSAPIV